MSRRKRVIMPDTGENEDYPEPQIPLPPPVGPEGFRTGDTKKGVAVLQLRLGCGATGVYDAVTEYAVRQMQRELGQEPNGVATPLLHHRLGLPYPPL